VPESPQRRQTKNVAETSLRARRRATIHSSTDVRRRS
jgi:hypothetical protein